MKVEKYKGWLKIDNQYYQATTDKDTGEAKFVKISEKEVKEIEKKIKEIIDKVVNSLNPREVLEDALMDLSINEIKGVHKTIFEKEIQPKVKKGCMEMKVGRYTIPIR